jgi:hypothetical protein
MTTAYSFPFEEAQDVIGNTSVIIKTNDKWDTAAYMNKPAQT